MNEEHNKSRLDQTRKSIRSRVTRQSMSQRGVPLDLTPVLEEGQRRFGKIGLGLATLVGLGALLWFVVRPVTTPVTSQGEPVAWVAVALDSVGGYPSRAGQDEGRLLDLTVGSPVYAGNEVVIADGSRPAALRMADNKSLRIDRGTRVTINSASDVVLDRGAVYIDSANALAGMEVRTVLGVVRDIGTQFEVRLLAGDGEDSLRVRVREGMVVLRHGQDDHGAAVGEELEMHGDGHLDRRSVKIYGEDWDWVMEAAPTPDLRSITLQALVSWLARESGKTFRFADETVARLAPTIVVSGYGGDDQTAMEAVEGLFEAEGLEMVEREGEVVLTKKP